MKKLIILLLLITSSICLISMEFINKEETYNLTLQQLSDYDQVEISTHRVKDGEVKDDVWTGISLKNILDDLGIKSFSRIKAIAQDNYMVRYNFSDVMDNDPIIALYRNGKQLDEHTIRLVAPSRRDMFWIQNIARIETEIPEKMTHPEVIYNSDPLLRNLELTIDPEPFKEVEGYFLRDLMGQVFPMLTGEFLLMGNDGVGHLLDYNSYLSKAVIIKTDNLFHMKSPQMPAGMWIQNIAYIQQDDTAILFSNAFEKLSDLASYLNWEEIPETLGAKSSNKTEEIKFDQIIDESSYHDLEKFEW